MPTNYIRLGWAQEACSEFFAKIQQWMTQQLGRCYEIVLEILFLKLLYRCFWFVGEFGDVCRGIWYKPSSKHLSVAIKTLKVQDHSFLFSAHRIYYPTAWLAVQRQSGLFNGGIHYGPVPSSQRHNPPRSGH